MSSLRLSLLFFALAALTACGRVHVGSDDGGGRGGDAGAGEPCGPVTCGPGTECCNASCGICTPPGVGCAAIACEDPCASNADCDAAEYCQKSACGDASGECVSRPELCDQVVMPVCGCDGTTYGNACEAAATGINVASDGACDGGGDCAPDDSAGDGLCDLALGIRWDGSDCVPFSGCSCVGADCGLYGASDGLTQCLADHASCLDCAADDATAVGDCARVLGVQWNGVECVGLSGCSCDGADCGRYSTLAECEAAHLGCGGESCGGDADCDPGEWCYFEQEGQCATGAGGQCVSGTFPGYACPDPGPPVCGCDGNTYQCDDHARSMGTSVLHQGACDSVCAPQDAMGVGACLLDLGARWSGSACEAVGGCDCAGADCAELYPSLADCQAATAGCERPPGGTCGGFAGDPCRPDEWCDYEPGDFCGGADALGRCRPKPESCSLEVAPVCGCDGVTYTNECEANLAGVDAAASGAC